MTRWPCVVTVLVLLSSVAALSAPPVPLAALPLSGSYNSDHAILIDIYHATDGDQWTTKTHWLSGADHCSWSGVTCKRKNIFDEYRVVELHLYYNNLKGALPASLGGLTELQDLCVDANYIGGTLPASIVDLAKLNTLFISGNHIGGVIPSNFDRLQSLQVIVASDNALSGTLQPLTNMPSLRRLSLGNNLFNGTLPDAFFAKLLSLDSVILSGNAFTGPLPSSLFHLPALTSMDLKFNQFTGSIPEVSGTPQLQVLAATTNLLSGPLPASLWSLSALRELYLENNLLSGSLSGDVAKLSSLRVLALAFNNLDGYVPGSLGSSPVIIITLHDNPLWCPFPASLFGAGPLGRHVDVTVNDCKLAPTASNQ